MMSCLSFPITHTRTHARHEGNGRTEGGWRLQENIITWFVSVCKYLSHLWFRLLVSHDRGEDSRIYRNVSCILVERYLKLAAVGRLSNQPAHYQLNLLKFSKNDDNIFVLISSKVKGN